LTIRIGRDRIIILGFFIAVILIGSILLKLPGAFAAGKLRYIDALFTATSAVCVTGLISVDTADFSLFGQLVILLLVQTGGLGIITFTTLFLAIPRRRISIVSRGLIGDYSLSEVEYKPKAILKAIVKYTIIFEAVGCIVFSIRFRALGLPIFPALFHSVSAFCNAGFSTFSTSLEGYTSDPIINFMTMFLIIVGGIGFIVIRDLRKFLSRQKMHISYHSRIVLTTSAFLIIAGTFSYLILEYDASMRGLPFFGKLMASLFQSVTTRTAGFNTIPQGELSQGSQLLTMVLMFIGASPASTGGGIKTTVFFVLMITALKYKESSDRINFNGRNLMPRMADKAVGVVVKGILIILVVSVFITLSEKGANNPVSLGDTIFETISAFATVGLSRGITFSLTSMSKILIIGTMFVGRVGLFALALPKAARDVEGYALLPNADIMI
jgi:trk system potassium uptake protein TrkH